MRARDHHRCGAGAGARIDGALFAPVARDAGHGGARGQGARGAVTLGARPAGIAENPQTGVVLRVSVLDDEPAGPERRAPAAAKKADKQGNSITVEDSSGTGGAGWTGIAAAAGAGAVVLVIAGLVFVRGRRGRAVRTTRGSA